MKTLVAAAALLLAWSATPASAFVVEVTTSVAVADADDQRQLKTALQAAVDNVLNDAISFTPTVSCSRTPVSSAPNRRIPT